MTHHLTRRHLLALISGALALAGTGLRAQTDEAALITDFGIGDVNAKVTIDEFLSFTCPHCANFHADVYPKLKADYIDTG